MGLRPFLSACWSLCFLMFFPSFFTQTSPPFCVFYSEPASKHTDMFRLLPPEAVALLQTSREFPWPSDFVPTLFGDLSCVLLLMFEFHFLAIFGYWEIWMRNLPLFRPCGLISFANCSTFGRRAEQVGVVYMY
jgi:hypothetical protein